MTLKKIALTNKSKAPVSQKDKPNFSKKINQFK